MVRVESGGRTEQPEMKRALAEGLSGEERSSRWPVVDGDRVGYICTYSLRQDMSPLLQILSRNRNQIIGYI